MNCSVCERWPISVGTSSYGVAFPIQVVEVYQTDAMTDPKLSVWSPSSRSLSKTLLSFSVSQAESRRKKWAQMLTSL